MSVLFDPKMTKAIRAKAKQISSTKGNFSSPIFFADNPLAVVVNTNAQQEKNNINHKNDDSDDNRNSETSKIYKRFMLCMLAILSVWLTSLNVALEIVNLSITVPSYDLVEQSCEYSYSVVDEQRKEYAECSQIQLQACENELNSDQIQENQRISGISFHNDIQYQNFQHLVQNCSLEFNLIKQAIKVWTDTGYGQTIPYSDYCSNHEIQQTNTALQSISSADSNAYVSSIDYSYTSQDIVSSLIHYVMELELYNEQYLTNKSMEISHISSNLLQNITSTTTTMINNTEQSVINQIHSLIACIGYSTNTSNICLGNTSATEVYHQIQQNYNTQITSLVGYNTVYKNALMELNSRINQVESNIQDFIDSISGAEGLVAWILSNSQVSESYLCDVSVPSWCAYTKNSIWTIFVNFPDVPMITSLPDASAVWQSSDDIIPTITSSISNSFEDLIKNLEFTESSRQIENIFSLNDYNPPSYSSDLQIVLSTQESNSEAFRSTIKNVFFSSNILNDSSESVATSTSTNITSLLSSISFSKFSLIWANFEIPNVHINIIDISMSSLTQTLTTLDTVYRIICSIYILIQYWSKSVVHLPVIDIRISKDLSRSKGWFELKLFTKIISIFWIQIIVAIVALILIISALSGLLAYELNSYTAGCVYHTEDHTFLSKILYSMAYNYASYNGNQIVSSGIEKYNSMMSQYCSDGISNTQTSYQQFVQNMENSNQTYQNTVRDMNFVTQCVNVTTLDQNFLEACCNNNYYDYYYSNEKQNVCPMTSLQCPIQNAQSNIPYFPISEYINQSFCSHDPIILDIQSSVYNCNHLEKCVITCDGPQPRIVYTTTKSCSCWAEWYLNAYLLNICFGIFVFLTINIVRILINDGLIHIYWKNLTEEVFEYTANCNINGQGIEKDMNSTQQSLFEHEYELVTYSDTKTEYIKLQIIEETKRYEWKGYIYLILSLLLNIPWIVLLVYTKQNLEYRSP